MPLPLLAQSPPGWQTAAGGKLAFDVASVKKHEIKESGHFRPPTLKLDFGDSYAGTGGASSPTSASTPHRLAYKTGTAGKTESVGAVVALGNRVSCRR